MISAPTEAAALPFPKTPAETITVLAHYHRAEIARMAGWRDRIDRTTNWAITVIAAMLSVSLSTPTAHHGVLLFAMLLVMLLLSIEARRYRFFDVYRTRVRQLERHYYAEVFAPSRASTPSVSDPGVSDPGWTRLLAEDLRHPMFHISLREAFGRRLRRNYGWMFAILLLAWVLKITSARLQETGPRASVAETTHGLPEILAGAGLGPLPGWLVLAGVACFYAWLLAAGLRAGRRDPDDGSVHV
ncbi:DUF2270 domain-containing protein [Methylobacterium frigidaeris]|uniref:DUF2270 domain-containing protein n=1 Tax=Methylobacterium frigidaeris TaxID=2038277 RepID=A0AA37M5W9_9HYPH|nr:DUF2270 domain-containing protein [Methylobacterium frigidaeris]PIK72995.1 hypothetical protein CS379_10875 [Methylobacterium frigidaeris]GJD63820.1 hypothetical protein MPEAHAMD_3991 [Methylobacterium frigidaeris]